ncbi:MAG: acetyl/propionyl/methylcrotonyl-CoA carboxylase subunit alpha [Acidobacteriia bacterium]|nr:acetyl/propionyl/methylcrotonyl-CoA carboxylase subunit alpha [Terriglobia bacterium]
MFRKILIANRGEIACRVIRTAQRLGIRTAAVYSEADADAWHVEMADEAYGIGAAPARESYLNIGRILEVAERSGAQAIHPGYGFLSENAEFAEACEKAGIVFIGPPASAIRAMGLKAAAKDLIARSGVPVVPGYQGAEQDLASFAEAAARIGYPVLLKASAGGGGKGMRIAGGPEELAGAMASAKREAASSFGNDRLLLERYLTRPRHIEVQVFADRYGNVIPLYERDCSIQRRYQKVIEEAPAPGLDAAQRNAMGDAACAAASAIGYVNAGTVEFIVQGDVFYFMEMNTRLQVEHPVTEAITGLDLVEWQLRVAAGERLPRRREDLRMEGHAIETRIYAEDPRHDFRPSIGKLTHLRSPCQSEFVRVDSGVRAGDSISIHYDPMIAKLIVRGADRDEAVARLRQALAEYEIAGVTTNVAFLSAVAAHPAYERAELDTGFLERYGAELLTPPRAASRTVLAAAVLHVLIEEQQKTEERAAASNDPWSPWDELTAWRMNGEGYQDLLFQDGERELTLRVYPRRKGAWRVDFPDGSGQLEKRAGAAYLDGAKLTCNAVESGNELIVFEEGADYHLKRIDPLTPHGAEREAGGRLTAPMPGRIMQVLVQKGAAVKYGAPLLILEAMKMEYTITAPVDGTIDEIRYAPGDVVEEGAELITLS